MKTTAFVFAASLALTPAIAAGQDYGYEDPFTDPYFNPWAAQDTPTVEDAREMGRSYGTFATPQQQLLEEQRRENSGYNSWMNRCHAMAGNAAAQARCYAAGGR